MNYIYIIRYLACIGLLTACNNAAIDTSQKQSGPYIDTVVGNGSAGDNGDGLAPRETSLYLPQDMALGPDANLYIVDWNNSKVRRVVGDKVETAVGSGEHDDSLGDEGEGLASEILLNHPTGIDFDDKGRMLIAAWHNTVIKRCDFTTSIVSTIAGNGERSFAGDKGKATKASLDLPSSVAFDGATGKIYISDQANFRIRVLLPDGTIDTICGDGTGDYTGDNGPAVKARLNSIVGQAAAPASRIVLNAKGEIIIADTGNHVIRLIDQQGQIRTIAGTGKPGFSGDKGPATEAQLDTPTDVAVGTDGTIYIADMVNNRVRMITRDGTIDTLAGTGGAGFSGDGGPAREAQLDSPYGVFVDEGGVVYIADTRNHRIRRVTVNSPDNSEVNPEGQAEVTQIPCTEQNGSICTYAGTGRRGFNGDGKSRLQSDLYWPIDIEFTKDHRRIVIDWSNHQVREILADDTLQKLIGTGFPGDGPADLSDLTEAGADPLKVNLNHATDIIGLPNDDLVLMVWHNHKIRTITKSSGKAHVVIGGAVGFTGDGGTAKKALINQPSHGDVDEAGNLFFVDQRNQRIRVIQDFVNKRGEGIVTTVIGTGEKGFNGDGEARKIKVSFQTGSQPLPSGGIAIDRTDGSLYFSDSENQRIRKVTFVDGDLTKGQVTTIAGTGVAGFSGENGSMAISAQLNNPTDLEFGPDGRLYFSDTGNNVVRRIDVKSGTIETVAGTGVRGYSGDGGLASGAQFDRPFGLAFDETGDLYVADSLNGRIRRIIMR